MKIRTRARFSPPLVAMRTTRATNAAALGRRIGANRRSRHIHPAPARPAILASSIGRTMTERLMPAATSEQPRRRQQAGGSARARQKLERKLAQKLPEKRRQKGIRPDRVDPRTDGQR